jgi:uncharacterized protein YrrD
MRMEELKGKPVMSVSSGTKLGSVHDFLLDDSYLQIAALVIGGGGLLGGHKQAVAYSAIHGIGPDAVMVNGLDAVQEVGGSGPLGPTHVLDEAQTQVMSESGMILGRVLELEFEPQTGSVTGLCFAVRGGKGPEASRTHAVAREDIISMTATIAIVRHSVVEQSADAREPARAQDLGQVVRHEPDSTAELDDGACRSGEEHSAPVSMVARP